MAWKIFPQLSLPDWDYWQRYFPQGVGSSAFSSPAWQRLMSREIEPPWKLCFLSGSDSANTRRSMPVFMRRGRWGRREITIRPIAYYVLPIEQDHSDQQSLATMIDAVASPWTAGLTWWLPPWVDCSVAELARANQFGQLTGDTYEIYMITLEVSADEYLRDCVSQTQIRHLRASYRKGIEVIERPSHEQAEEYDRLYRKVWADDRWVGPRSHYGFFHGIAQTMDEGGRLVLLRYQDRIVGGGVVLFDKSAVHYYQGTIDRTVRDVYPHCVLYEQLLRYAEQRGLRYVNLGGVNEGNEGLVRFKESWGGRRVRPSILRWRYDGPHWLRKFFHRVEGWWGSATQPQSPPASDSSPEG